MPTEVLPKQSMNMEVGCTYGEHWRTGERGWKGKQGTRLSVARRAPHSVWGGGELRILCLLLSLFLNSGCTIESYGESFIIY